MTNKFLTNMLIESHVTTINNEMKKRGIDRHLATVTSGKRFEVYWADQYDYHYWEFGRLDPMYTLKLVEGILFGLGIEEITLLDDATD